MINIYEYTIKAIEPVLYTKLYISNLKPAAIANCEYQLGGLLNQIAYYIMSKQTAYLKIPTSSS